MKIAVTGHRGRLGAELIQQGCEPLCYDQEIDITDLGMVVAAVHDSHPDVIINCAAHTDVDACEQEAGFNAALRVNFQGVENLLRAFPGRIFHISTDYVFDGRSGPYKEELSTTPPVNEYGWTKLGGEHVFLSAQRPGNILIRTTGLYGRTAHHDFFKLVYNTLQAGKELKVSSSLRGNQTYAPHLAEALIQIAHRPDDFRDIPILNVASEEVVSRYEFALMIATIFGLDKRLLLPRTNPQIKNWIAARPTQGGLRVKLAQRMDVPIYTIKRGLEALHGENITA